MQTYLLQLKALAGPYLKTLAPYFDDIKNFQFTVANPLFWAFIFATFLIFLKLWTFRKALSFCVILVVLLLATTKIENIVLADFNKSDDLFYPFAIRLISALFISLAFIYYAFLKGDA